MHATLGTLSGEAAVYKVVGWNEGAFLIDFERGECPRTVTHSTQSVLLEALRRFDEAQRDVEIGRELPERVQRLCTAPPTAAPASCLRILSTRHCAASNVAGTGAPLRLRARVIPI